MAGLVQWLLSRRYRLIVLAAVLAPVPVLVFVSSALMTLETLYRGSRNGVYSAVVATLVAIPFAWAWGVSPTGMALESGAVLFAGVGLGALLRRTGSLALTFQGVGLACAVGALLAALLWPEPGAWVTAILDGLAEVARSGGATEEQVSSLSENLGPYFTGLMVAGIYLQLMAALLLGSWWASKTQQESQFGPQFRQLRLGRILGIPATLLMASSLVLDGAVVRNLFPLVLFAFWFQGIAVVHAWAWAKRWSTGFLVPMYVLLIMPITAAVTILLLASVGLVDNWIELRRPLAGQPQKKD